MKDLDDEIEMWKRDYQNLKDKYAELQKENADLRRKIYDEVPKVQPKGLIFLPRDKFERNNSMFEAFLYAFDKIHLDDFVGRRRAVKSLRRVVSSVILRDWKTFTKEELDNKTPEDYADLVEEDNYLGGKTELMILSEYFKTGIWKIIIEGDSQTNEYFTKEKKYEKVIYLLFDQEMLKYSLLVGNSSKTQDFKEDIKCFSSQDTYARNKIFNFLQERRLSIENFLSFTTQSQDFSHSIL